MNMGSVSYTHLDVYKRQEEYRVVGLAVQRPASMAPAVEQMFPQIVDYCRQLELPL